MVADLTVPAKHSVSVRVRARVRARVKSINDPSVG